MLTNTITWGFGEPWPDLPPEALPMEDHDGDTDPAPYVGPDGAVYSLARTGWRCRPLAAFLLWARVVLPPGEQVPCSGTTQWRQPPGRSHPFCAGWTDRGWLGPSGATFLCEGCRDDLRRDP